MTFFRKKWLLPVLFSLGGGMLGYIYYHFFGCTTGCPITSSPYLTTLYMAAIGWLLSCIFRKDEPSCNM